MNILLIAPNAPPKSGPESLQVSRFLSAIGGRARITMVTTADAGGWTSRDITLLPTGADCRIITLSLPLHHLTTRIWRRIPLALCQMPDGDRWQTYFANYIRRQLDHVPDIIYSRSGPFSGALLAMKLKKKFRRPWLMHLSDPWAGSPYRSFPPSRASRDLALERSCIEAADHVTLTTEGQAAFYRERYPARAQSISVAPNMMPASVVAPHHVPKGSAQSGTLRLVYTGAFYGARKPTVILEAMKSFRKEQPELAKHVSIDFYGNMMPDIAAEIAATEGCRNCGVVTFETALQAQREADVLLAIEPAGDHPLLLHFMPSKVLDYVSTGKPILAVTPRGSETARLCEKGFGWAVPPDVAALAQRLTDLARAHQNGSILKSAPVALVEHYHASRVTGDILHLMQSMCATHAANNEIR